MGRTLWLLELCCQKPGDCQKLGEKPGRDPFLKSSEGPWPCPHLDFGLLASELWDNEFLWFLAAQFVMICCSSLGEESRKGVHRSLGVQRGTTWAGHRGWTLGLARIDFENESWSFTRKVGVESQNRGSGDRMKTFLLPPYGTPDLTSLGLSFLICEIGTTYHCPHNIVGRWNDTRLEKQIAYRPC